MVFAIIPIFRFFWVVVPFCETEHDVIIENNCE